MAQVKCFYSAGATASAMAMPAGAIRAAGAKRGTAAQTWKGWTTPPSACPAMGWAQGAMPFPARW